MNEISVVGSSTHLTNLLNALKKKLTEECDQILERVMHDSCEAISKRLQQVIDALTAL